MKLKTSHTLSKRTRTGEGVIVKNLHSVGQVNVLYSQNGFRPLAHGGIKNLNSPWPPYSPCLRESLFFFAVAAVILALTACTSKQILEDPPIITSATHQHTLYNGRGQSIEAVAAKEDAPAPVITYFRSEEDLHADRDGSSEPPAEVGDYYVRIRRPAGKGYRAGKDITVEFHIQKALVTITADEVQEFMYDGNPRAVVFSVDQNVKPGIVYYHKPSHARSSMYGFPLNEAPTEPDVYLAVISWAGDAHYMGASKEVTLVIK